MTEYHTRVARVCALLNATGASYAVAGATAMQLWGSSRATRDVDILIEPTVDNAARVLKALSALGFGFAAQLTASDVATQPVTMVGDTPNVDILTRAWNVTWQDASKSLRFFDVEGVRVPTLSLNDLIASKRTGRLQDLADIESLEAIRRSRTD